MLFKLLYALLIIIEIVFVPLYLKKMWPVKNWVSLGYKMICATAYILIGVLAMAVNGSAGRFAVLMMAGLGFSWLGDLLLHIPKGNMKAFFGLGMVAFLTAHFFYIASFIQVQSSMLPELPLLRWQEVAAAVIISAVFIVVCYMRGVRYEIFLIPCCAYGLGVSLMMVKAVSLAIHMIAGNIAGAPAAAALLIFGGLCFLQSDASLALISFDTRFKKFKLKVYNIVTYFLAQVCLASTIFILDK